MGYLKPWRTITKGILRHRTRYTPVNQFTLRSFMDDAERNSAEPQPKRMKLTQNHQYGKIALLPGESLLRDLLLDCRKQLKDPSLGMWITGGWVRDRLLGIPCSDIDIALSNLTGVQFGNALTEYLKSHGTPYIERAAQLGLPKPNLKGFQTTKKNLDKSKKLETAVGNLFGFDLDLVNLRKEVYEDDSRTPEMEFGTAEEDAFRRDATINSMFFDLIEQEVVDLTGKGLQDLSAHIMRTPLEPRQTFLDDPLRVLRLVRIGSKLGYDIDPEAIKSMEQKEIHQALNDKVSRERIGIEVFKMMKGGNAQAGFEVIFKTDLYETVFLGLDSGIRKSIGEEFTSSTEGPWPKPWIKAVRTVANLKDTSFDLLKSVVQAKNTREQLWTMVAYCPLATLSKLDFAKRKNFILQIQEPLKLTKMLAKLIDSALMHLELCQTTVKEISDSKETPARSSIGMKLRKMGGGWQMQLMFAALSEIVHKPESSEPKDQEEINAILERYETFLSIVYNLELQDVVSTRPIIDGNAIIKLLESKGGPWLSGAIERLVEWQLDHREAGVEEATAWLRENGEVLKNPPK